MNPRTIILAGIAAVAVIGAACSDSNDDSSQTTAPVTQPTAVGVDAPATPAAPAAQATAAPAPAAAAAPTKLNLNTATGDQFRTVPGVADRMVREFEEYRPYTSVAQFKREIGKYVSQDQVNIFLQHVFVPVDPNRADAETIQQIPGVDASEAAQLVGARPYASTDVFLTRLSQYVAPAEAQAARGYLTGS